MTRGMTAFMTACASIESNFNVENVKPCRYAAAAKKDMDPHRSTWPTDTGHRSTRSDRDAIVRAQHAK